MLKVTNNQGRVFNIRLVVKGMSYGINGCLIYQKDEPLVEFYDATYANRIGFSERGQFVEKYYLKTILGLNTNSGLILDEGVPEWQVSITNLKQIKDYCKRIIEKNNLIYEVF